MTNESRALLIVDNDETAKAFKQRIDTLADQTKEQIAFFQKRSEQELDKAIAQIKGGWDEFIAYMRSKGLIPSDYDESKHHFLIQDGAVLMVNTERGHGKSLLRLLKILAE